VLSAIGFHDQFPARAYEIRDVRADRHLAPKFRACESTISQQQPKLLFRVSLIAA
jgi:hypothetical protein